MSRERVRLVYAFAFVVMQPGASFGQFKALPDSDAVWYTHVWDQWSLDAASTMYLEPQRHDTTINDTTYAVVRGYHDLEQWPGYSIGGVHDNGTGRTFYYHPYSGRAYLLSDYNVVVGDSVQQVWFGDPWSDFASTHTIYVVQVDTILIGDRWRKAIGIVGAPPQFIGYDPIHWWIQGIGGTGGLLETSGLTALDVSGGLECMSQGDSILWHWGPAGYPGSCLSVGLEEQLHQERSLFPNPNDGHFAIRKPVPSPVLRAWATDALGRQVGLKALDRGSFIECSVDHGMANATVFIILEYANGFLGRHQTCILP